MEGVDFADKRMSNNRIGNRGKNWWWPFSSNYVNLSIVNARRLWQCAETHESITRQDLLTPSYSEFTARTKSGQFKSDRNMKVE